MQVPLWLSLVQLSARSLNNRVRPSQDYNNNDLDLYKPVVVDIITEQSVQQNEVSVSRVSYDLTQLLNANVKNGALC